MKAFLILAIAFFCTLNVFAQNLITNPDFSRVSVEYRYGKIIYPTDWKYWNFVDGLTYSHPVQLDTDFKQVRPQKKQGIVTIKPMKPSQGITTRLAQKLESGVVYTIEIELKPDRIYFNSDITRPGKAFHMDGTPLDSAEFDYYYFISLVTYFTSQEPDPNCKNRSFVIFDLPKGINIDQAQWLTLRKEYTANGTETNFSIGTFNTEDYVDILRKEKNDTVDYYHKWARYMIRHVSITPPEITDEQLAKENTGIPDNSMILTDGFEFDSTLKEGQTQSFILRNVNFEFSSAVLTESAQKEMLKMAEFLKKETNLKLKIVGHTDSVGSESFNQKLSEQRAHSIYEFLQKQGIDKGRLSFEGKGETQPLDLQTKAQNQNLDRRVEFKLSRN